MSLFKINKTLIESEEVDNYIDTPLGRIILNLKINDDDFTNKESVKKYMITDKSTLIRWENEHYEVELILSEPDTSFTENFKIVKCVAAIWRFKLKSIIEKVYLETKFIESDCSVDLSCSYDHGQHLFAMQFENKSYNLHIGTQDEEVLVNRRIKNDYFPVKISNADTYSPFVDTHKGISMLLDNLEVDEICQVHFIVSWAKYKEWDVSTWLAVDSDTEKLLPDFIKYNQ